MAGLGTALLAAFGDLADRLTAAGVDTRLEADQVQVPGAWLSPRYLDTDRGTLTSPGTATANLYLIAADTGDTHALTVLAGLLDTVWPHITESDTGEQLDISSAVVLPDTPTALPAFRISIDLAL